MKVFILKNFGKSQENLARSYLVKENNKNVYSLGAQSLNVTQWACSLLRKFGCISKSKIMISVENQQNIIQLSLAKINKNSHGEFDADASDVISIWKQLWDAKIQENDLISENYNQCKASYEDFLENGRLVDHLGLLQLLEQERLKADSPLNALLSDVGLIIQDCSDLSTIDKRLLHILCKGASICELSLPSKENSLDISGIIPNDDENIEISTSTMEDIECTPSEKTVEELLEISDPYSCVVTNSKSTSNKGLVQKLFSSCIRLLVNTKDELALAHLLNVPGTNIEKNDFNLIKAAARKKNMPIYQTIFSSVMKQKLGGSDYQPDPKCPLVIHAKALENFFNFMMKLQCVVEEQADQRKASVTILTLIRNHLKKLDGNPLSCRLIETVCKDFQANLQYIVETNLCQYISTNDETTGASCASQTLKVSKALAQCLKYLLCLCDRTAGSHTEFLIENLTGDSTLCRATPKSNGKFKSPVVIPSIVNLYRSPSSPKPSTPNSEAKSLADRLNSKTSGPSDKPPIAKRFKSHCSWASSDSPVATPVQSPSDSPFSPIIGPTLVAAGPRIKRAEDWKDIIEDLDKNKEEKLDSPTKSEEPPTKKIKRSLLSDMTASVDGQNKNSVSSEAKAPKPKKQPKKKSRPLPTGQKTITSFFFNSTKVK